MCKGTSTGTLRASTARMSSLLLVYAPHSFASALRALARERSKCRSSRSLCCTRPYAATAASDEDTVDKEGGGEDEDEEEDEVLVEVDEENDDKDESSGKW